MTALVTNVVGPDGHQFDGDYVSASGSGDDCDTGPGVLLLVKNGDGSSHTVTLATPREVDGLAIADRAVSVPGGADTAIPVTHRYRDSSDGRASITYDAVTSVTVAVIRVAA